MKIEHTETSESKVVNVIKPFNYCGVKLRKSMFQKQFSQATQYYLTIPSDDILKGFRERARLSAPGKHLGGWYTIGHNGRGFIPTKTGGWYVVPHTGGHGFTPTKTGHAFGQWLSAFARMYRVTGDSTILRKIKYLLNEWGKTVEADGRFFYGIYPNGTNFNIGHYKFDKIVGGLVDTYEYADKKESIKYLRRVVDWGISHLNRRRLPAIPSYNCGGSWINGEGSDGEWYTLSENLYRAYSSTGDPVYRDFAKIWHYDSYWGNLAEKKHCMTGLHAYSHVNTLSSAAMAYAVSRNNSYLISIVNAYEILQKTQVFATGGYGPGEIMANQYGSLGDSLYLHNNTFEAPCGTWAAFKLARYLMMFTGKSIYGDWIEKLLYNGIGAALPMGEKGKTYYYSDYRVSGGKKIYHPAVWPCCSGTYPLAIVDYHNVIYFKDEDSLYVNIFMPSEVEWNKQGHSINLIQDTDYPETGRVSLRINTSKPIEFSLKFRIPAWVRDTVLVKVNKKLFLGEWKPSRWGKLNRIWSDGDIVDIELPLDTYFVPVDSYHPNLAALMYGPVVLVADKPGALQGNIEDPSSWILPATEQGIVFQTKGQSYNKKFRPYFAYEEKERYYMYQKIEK